MLDNQKEKLFGNKFVQQFLKNESKLSNNSNEKFFEIAYSLAYYLKSFSNINKLLDYVSLIFKYIFNQKLLLIIPLNDEGLIWNENIKISANDEFLPIQEEINSFLVNLIFKNFKPKEISLFENSLKNKFKEYKIESEKISSRGKCKDLFMFFITKSLINLFK